MTKLIKSTKTFKVSGGQPGHPEPYIVQVVPAMRKKSQKLKTCRRNRTCSGGLCFCACQKTKRQP